MTTELAQFIEHTVLRPDTTLPDIHKLCEEAMQYNFAGVCIPPYFVRDARRIFGDMSSFRVATVVGFPMGYTGIAARSEEIRRAIDDGADEVNAVINIAALKSDNWNHVNQDIDSIARATHMRGKTLKLTLECGLLSESEIRRICELAVETHVTWLETSTGMHGYSCTAEMIRTLRKIASPDISLKATGGILTAKIAQELVDAGADRLGTSAALQIIGK